MNKSWRRPKTKVGRILRTVRREQRLTQAEAAKRCGYGRQHFNQIENGRLLLKPEDVDDFSSALGIEKDELMHAALEDFLPTGWGAHQT